LLEGLIEGFEAIERLPELERRLAIGRPLRVKLGLDPTSPDLHLGHAVLLHRLQRFVEAGHHVLLVIGDFTARIGDPSGRNEARPPLSDDAIAANMATYTDQASKVLDLERIEIRYNRSWLEGLGVVGLLRLLSQVTVAQMLKRDDFAQRYADGRPIALHEFLYPIAQAYDSVELQADVELGGTDQRFNLLMGRHYQELHGQAPQVCMMTPLLEGIDGVKKMSKSTGNGIGLTEAAEQQFGKTMRIPDELIVRWEHLVLGTSSGELRALEAALRAGRLHPMEEKKRIAAAIVRRYHGDAAAQRAREHFERTVQQHQAPTEISTYETTPGRRLVDLLVEVGFAESKRAAQRELQGGGVRIDGVPVREMTACWGTETGVLSLGSRRFLRIMPTLPNTERS